MTHNMMPADGGDSASAGYFARAAKRTAKHLDDPEFRRHATQDEREVLAAEALAFAATSLSLTSLNPRARQWRDRPRRPRLETRGETR